ncbi:MAG: signal transduction histidine kinase [Flavipsychrobacter sp.]|jgi:two-component system CheB/CheR fusion protein|nr:signal transduction histidine kinase [Flavipsychrobacter sp.]
MDTSKEQGNTPGENDHSQGQNGFLIVGIGASAGGIQALREFFDNVPPRTGAAYVVILHLSPDHDSKLAEVIRTVTKLPVEQVTEKTRVKPDHVYVIPPNRHLTMEDAHIVVSPNLQEEDRRAPVDIFFRTMADAYQSKAVCVVLSGTGANGSMGLKRIKEQGGATFVQNPREAEFNEMPRNAIATDMVDEVLPVAEIPRRIIEYYNSQGLVQIPIEADKRPEDQQQALREVFTQLRLRTGHDFSNYKRPTLLRRIERRINVRKQPDLTAYATLLQTNPAETTALLKDLLISVTNFFRDKKAFEFLSDDVLPRIIRSKPAGGQVRIWVAGCATGEEAYSLAMLCAEQTMNVMDAPKIQVFATDIDEAAIAHAREGLYTINDAADVSPERLRRFFNKEGVGYRVRREIREMILFATHNFMKDPPFSHLDLISCRNVLIYLNHNAQDRVMETFHFALDPGAFLFVGSSESADTAGDLYSIYSRDFHIFQKRQISTARTYPVPESVPSFRFERPTKTEPTEQEQVIARNERITFGELHQRLLEEYAPPSLIVNEEHEIVHLSERAGRYLQMAGGEPSQNLLKLVRQELRLELRSALYQAAQRHTTVEARGLKLTIDDKTETINILVRPVLTAGDVAKGFILVIFEPAADTQENQRVVLASDEPVARQLEDELMRIKTQLRASNEQHEFHAEELKASNEELQAMNEELRSAAEELETSKEELQSINEELRTVNQELKVKVEETTLAGNNLHNLINSVDIATIFLDRSFRVAFFTPAAREVFNLIPADYGRPLSDITGKLSYTDLMKDAEFVLDKLQPVEREVVTSNGRFFHMRVLPYRTEEDRINGVVITFIDMTARKRAEYNLARSEERLRLLIESAKDYAIFTLDTDRRISGWNTGAQAILGYSEQEIVGQPGDIIFVPEDRAQNIPEKEVGKARDKGMAENERWHLRKDGTRFYGSGTVRPLHNNDGSLLGFVKIMRDLTEQKQAEEALRQSEERLRITMESATDYAIVTLDTGGYITSWSKGAEQTFGFTEEEVKGKNGDIIFTPEDRAAGIPEKEIGQAATEGRALDERWHLRKDGTRFYMSGVMAPIVSGNRLMGFVKVARDMTDRKLMEQEKDDFIGVASHELRTPVTSIKSYVELLHEALVQSGDTENLGLTDKLEVQVDRLTELIHLLLDTSRITGGRLPLNFESFRIDELLTARVEELKKTYPTRRFVVRADAATVNADKERIGQVLINFISNAIKYSPENKDIVISSEIVGDDVRVTVEDFGKGIAPENREKVFDRFYRDSENDINTYPGLGLGLYIAAQIIKQHKGQIGVVGKPGDGATFYFTVPTAVV